MKEVFLSNSINLITKYQKFNKKDTEKLKYGLEGIYLTITKLFIIIILSIILNITKEVLLLLLLFNIIRYPSFGVHANKSSTCLILSTLLIIGLTLLLTRISINSEIKTILCIICIIDYILFAPADTIKRPLTNKKKRIYRKIFASVIAIIYTILTFKIKNGLLALVIFEALLIEAIMINPLTYKILKMPYNNYKNVS